MAYDKDQKEFALPVGKNRDQKSSNLLPKYFRTDTNKKFLSSTIDQMTTPGVIEKIDAFAGRRYAKAAKPTDSYLSDISKDRENYQLEPVVVYKDEINNVEFLKDYNDYLGIVKNFRGSTSNHSLLNSQEYYSWNPHIDWDKFTNFREYYWLPFGPQSIPVAGQSVDVESTFTVTVVEDLGTAAYVFSPDGLTRNPSITLYRGQTYRFEINTPGNPFAIAIIRTVSDTDLSIGMNLEQDTILYKEGITTPSDYVEDGVIEFTVPENAPTTLYYVSESDINVSGSFTVLDITESSEINVEHEILGKKSYKTSNGYDLSNGMKVFFQGAVTPAKYKFGNWYVEGVGDAIRLVAESDLEIPAIFTSENSVPFDVDGWDTLPFDDATSFAGEKDYIVINRTSADRNPWSRYNRWFHRDVIKQSAEINKQLVQFDQDQRAKRPIIEFESGLKLFKHGSRAKQNVTLVDDFTRDVFSTIEGSIGYNVDGVDLADGMRVLFTADTDILVNGRIYQVKFINHLGIRQIALIETDDSEPSDGETVLIINGKVNKGRMLYFENGRWNRSQEKTGVNQSPLFDVYDSDGILFNDEIQYPSSTFSGNKIFSYRPGFGPVDDELGFAINYRNIANLGDIVFDFNLLSESFEYQSAQISETKLTDAGFIKKYDYLGNNFEFNNAWQKANKPSRQAVLKQYTVTDVNDTFAIDVFNNSAELADLSVIVILNNTRQQIDTDYRFENISGVKTVVFNSPLSVDDSVLLKCYSSSDKNSNGFYEIPANLERNPLNDNVTTFTLGEVNDHVDSIIENLDNFEGTFPGENNLRDLGPVSQFGTKFVQHSGPLNIALFHLTDKTANIIKALRFAKTEYSRFKRQFMVEAEKLGTSGSVKDQVDEIIAAINKDRIKDQPFYFSDMLGYGSSIKNSFVIPQSGPRFIPLSVEFSLSSLSARAVYVYVNDSMLVHGIDYQFSDSFVNILKDLNEGDIVDIYEFESTNGSFIPQTPSKLGLMPVYEPKILIDTTYVTPRKMIQGHDGSFVLAYDDYRDELVLEFEKRIFNNIKKTNSENIIDIFDLVEGKNRNTGISTNKVNNIMLADFSRWLEQVGSPDYTDSEFWDKDNAFTYNYSSMGDRNSEPLNGYWRNIYKFYFDTDRPHSHPWEMIGFTSMPTWWESVYGPAPYTKNNTVLWRDLSEGLIKEPGKLPVRNKKFVRPELLDIIPVDESGNLVDPLAAGIARNFVLTKSKSAFKFGDHAPVETAWRRSSDFPFSLLTAWILLQPAKMFGLGFDTSRIKRDLTGNLVYNDTGKRIQSKHLQFPCICVVEDLKLTSGLVNYISNYLTSYRITNQVAPSYLKYQKILSGLTSQLAIKIGGFADKSKVKLILDSRTPLNKGNVFVPDENYQIVFNKTSPLDTAVLSGIIIEKTANGFTISGYDKEDPVFTVNKFVNRSADPAITVGGISESFVSWSSGQEYPIGTVVENQNRYFRSRITHRSADTFDLSKFVQLPELPIVGGATATIRTQFENDTDTLPYGTNLTSIQEVVDFMVSYDVYLRQQGFNFEFFNRNTSALEDMQLCIKEFLFWTTQNWDLGSVLTVSPVANRVEFERSNFVVDDIYDSFYDYNLLAADGTRISREFSNVFRDSSSEFGVRPVGTADGIYLVKLPLVQKEHLVLIDNITAFNDVIFDKVPGYRQERIRVVGYRTADWNGGLNIPGFFYDEALVTLWEPWKDYALGDLIKYKEFYYSANKKHASSESFDANNWNILPGRPESELFPNWDYRANQFADFYDLDSDNFDTEQQRLAQHLIGYQKREYLANIIVDDVSQYKFYQGFIQEKGTLNSLTRLFDSLSSADKDSLEFYEEWAIRLGQYGATTNIEEFEYILDESQFRSEPQLVELTPFVNTQRLDLVYEIPKYQTYLKPDNYEHTPFRVIESSDVFAKDGGYVRDQDIDIIVGTVNDILTLDIATVLVGQNFWVLDSNNSWTVYRHVRTPAKINAIEDGNTTFVAVFDQFVDFEINEIIGINTADEVINGFYKVDNILLNRVTFSKREPASAFSEIDDSTIRSVTKLVERRFTDVEEINNRFYQLRDTQNERVWLDNYDNAAWAVLENKNVFSAQTEILNPLQGSAEFAKSFAVNKFNTVMVVGAPNETFSFQLTSTNSGSVRVYNRAGEQNEWKLAQLLTPSEDLSKFGSAVAVTNDSKYIIVGAPALSNTGAVFVYERSNTGIYRVIQTIENPSLTINGLFGATIEVRETSQGNRIFVSAPGNSNGIIYVYDLIDGLFESVSQINVEDSTFGVYENFGKVFNVNEFGDVLISGAMDQNDSTQKSVTIYRLNDSNNWVASQQINYYSELESFGNSVAINDVGNKIAIGAPDNDEAGTDNGCVYIYQQINGEFELHQTLFSPFTEFNEQFGEFVEFSRNRLIVSSKNGDFTLEITFDNLDTTFDNNTTRISDVTKNVGKVYVFQEINNYHVYGEDLNKVDTSEILWNNNSPTFETIEKIRFNSITNLKIAGNHIYLALPESVNDDSTIGSIIDCRADLDADSWSVLTKQESKVDITQFKRCFIYSKSQNKILVDLDVIDPRQGKIPAPAEQEISFKTFYDPAIYSSADGSTASVVVDAENAWTKTNVGKLWWNLSSNSWYNPYQGSTQYRASRWNSLIPNSTVQVCEWIETTLLPSEWSLQADTNEGFANGISGQPLYDTNVYSVKRDYDPIANRFTNKYYYWVVGTTIVPQNELRLRSAREVSQLIESPDSLGYRYLAPLGNNKFALYNVNNLVEGTDSVLHFTLIKDNASENNVHSEYQLLTEGVADSKPSERVEQKWIDSLVGYDRNRAPIPDPNLSVKEKYGILSVPNQGMFINRLEAVKQFVERVNGVLINEQITDNYDLSKLLEIDDVPDFRLGLYDTETDSRSLLRFVSVARVVQAELEPVIQNGRIVSVNIVNPGRGYKTSPQVKIETNTGSGAIIELAIDSIGKIVRATVRRQGSNYSDVDSILIRKFSVLIKNDELLQGKWSVVEWDVIAQQWNTVLNQSFNTTEYWNYVDWFAPGYTELSLIDYTINQSYELFGIPDQIGDVVKINTVGQGGWLLLEKVNNINTEDYSLNYNVVGRENGTIQLSKNLYNYATLSSGYDVALYDSIGYDKEPVQEFRNILEALRDDIFVSDLAVEWNKVFFSSVRYVLSEQRFVDWVFKTSFVKAIHNLGNLEQKVTFQNDNLESYEAYVNEVKPYSTKIREYVSNYGTLEPTRSTITDFDLPPSYGPESNRIEVSEATYDNGEIFNIRQRYESYPFKHWVDNVGFELIGIDVIDSGEGYLQTPVVTILGNSGATAEAFVARGKISRIEITNPGAKLLDNPEIQIVGPIAENGRVARAISKIGNSVIRTPSVTLKFDRVSSAGMFNTLETIEEFVGTGAQEAFELKWPVDTNSNRYKVFLDGIQQLSSEISIANRLDITKDYDREIGVLTFAVDPEIGARIRIEYNKDVSLLSAVDRINFFYTPIDGMPGKDISQLMDGVEYSGVTVDSFGFETNQGWDVGGWGGQWDTFNLDDDGNFIPPEENYDTSLRGGEFTVLSAAGIASGEIVVDGDGFVTPTTSKGPEELVPGQLGDTLDLKVYHRVVEGAGIIGSTSYLLDGIQTEFKLPGLSVANDGTIVKINNVILNSSQYTIDYLNETLVLGSVGTAGERLSIITTGTNGANLITFNSEVYDGSTLSIVTDALWRDEFFLLVTVNGIIARDTVDYTVSESDTKRIMITFDPSFVSDDSLIQYAVYDTDAQTYSQILIDNTFVADGTNSYHEFDQVEYPVPFDKEPLSHNVLIKAGDRILNPGYSARFITTSDREYPLEQWQLSQISNITQAEILVFADGTQVDSTNFTYDPTSAVIRILRNDIAIAGAELEVYVIADADYYFVDTKINIDTDLSSSIQPGDGVTISSPGSPDLLFIAIDVAVNYITVKTYNREVLGLSTINPTVSINGTTVAITDVSFVLGTGITFRTAPTASVEIYQFSNHDVNNFARKTYTAFRNIDVNTGTLDNVNQNLLAEGIIQLKDPSVSENYVWVIKNGLLLTPKVDYVLENSTRIILADRPSNLDDFDILQFRNLTPVRPKLGYRIFKDVLGRAHYKRLNQKNSYVLSEPLNYYDIRIKLKDAKGITKPNRRKNVPGVVFVNGERIEYFEVRGNSLLQLRRGTLGTSIKEVYDTGTRIFGQSADENILYRDEVVNKKEIANGEDTAFDLGFDIGEIVNNYETATQRSTVTPEDFVDVYVAGKKLRKASLMQFNAANDQDSPEADIMLPAEFEIDVENNQVILQQQPPAGVRVNIVRKLGRVWNEPGKSLEDSENAISNFLRGATIEIPK